MLDLRVLHKELFTMVSVLHLKKAERGQVRALVAFLRLISKSE